MLQEPHIRDCPNKRMTGTKLRQLRVRANISERELAKRFGTHQRKIQRWQDLKQFEFELLPQEMERLLSALGEQSVK